MRDGRQNERGSTLVTTAFFATALIVFVGLVTDAGLMMYERTRMQVAADAAALAGAKALLNSPGQAVVAAQELAKQNGFPITASQVKIEKGSRVTVAIDSPTDSLVSRVLAAGQAQAEPKSPAQPSTFLIGAQASADLHCVEVQHGARPWGVPETDFGVGREYVLKQGAGNSIRGNFQALALDGSGANIYRQAILNGSKTTVKAGDMIATEPGNMNGPTVTAVNQLVGNDRTSYEQARLNPSRTPRVVTVVLLNEGSYFGANGRSNVEVSGFARFFVTYTTNRGEVYGRFMDRVNTNEIIGTRLNYAVKLVDSESPIVPAI
jgi:Flp pilus assembly protein TadG